MRHLGRFSRILLIAFAVLFAIAPFAAAKAEGDLPPADTPCKNCHETLYYLYDTGRWYCQCAMRSNCTSCHGGDASQTNDDLAHAGMVANPATDNPAVCQSCHPQDYAEKIEKFLAVSGVHATKIKPPTLQLSALAEPAPASKLAIPPQRPPEFQPWRAAGVLAGILVVAGICFAICRKKCANKPGEV